ncbi:MAG: hypothetical protein E6J01_05315 [Chloroflexi bacterium]|nr:MAG: hypothetical protein E6J01_05315 [Chloroflexota bacterium]
MVGLLHASLPFLAFKGFVYALGALEIAASILLFAGIEPWHGSSSAPAACLPVWKWEARPGRQAVFWNRHSRAGSNGNKETEEN